MKFIAALLVITLMCVVLAFGIGLAAYGHGVWFLVLASLAFLALFVHYGCRTH